MLGFPKTTVDSHCHESISSNIPTCLPEE
jgi:hypothetical protein